MKDFGPPPNLGFVADHEPPEDVTGAHYYVFHEGRALDLGDGDWAPIAAEQRDALEDVLCEIYMGSVDGRPCFAVGVGNSGEGEYVNLRSVLDRTTPVVFALTGRGAQLVAWHLGHRYCGRCGRPTEPARTDRSFQCSRCRLNFYPRLSPSMIVLVTRGEELLLARNVRWPEGRYSTLAGFVEPGESVEDTLHREVREEVGVTITNLRYKGSQSWPFPNSLMLGFHADYSGGEIRPQDGEIADARFFHYRELPQIPGKTAISRWLIDDYVALLAG